MHTLMLTLTIVLAGCAATGPHDMAAGPDKTALMLEEVSGQPARRASPVLIMPFPMMSGGAFSGPGYQPMPVQPLQQRPSFSCWTMGSVTQCN